MIRTLVDSNEKIRYTLIKRDVLQTGKGGSHVARLKKQIVVAFLLTLWCTCILAKAPIKLYKEETRITLEKNSVTIQGYYYFENNSDFELDVDFIYPFHVSSLHFFPEKISILDPRSKINFTKRKEAVKWTVHFLPVGMETVYVGYQQEIKEKSVLYILNKFRTEKIDKLQFIIEIPLDLMDISISLKPDSSKTIDQTKFFYITRRYFKPQEKLKITWK